MMKAWQVGPEWGLDNLALVERELPEPGPGELRIAVRAAALNYRDLLMVKGHYNPKIALPLIPLSDAVGIVDAVGPGVDAELIGRRRAACFAPTWLDGEPTYSAIRDTLGGPRDGGLASHLIVPAAGTVEPPRYLSDEEAATLPCAAVTAWSALVTYGQLRAGSTVLIQGTGGVSIFALQLAKFLGCRVLATTGQDAKMERVLELGADAVVNYKTNQEWGRWAKKQAGGGGVDLVVDVGGAATIDQSIAAVRPGGTVSMIGILGGVNKALALTKVLMSNLRLQGILVGHKAGFEAMNRAFEVGQLRPVISDVFEFADARAAFDHIAAGKHFGKIVIRGSEA